MKIPVNVKSPIEKITLISPKDFMSVRDKQECPESVKYMRPGSSILAITLSGVSDKTQFLEFQENGNVTIPGGSKQFVVDYYLTKSVSKSSKTLGNQFVAYYIANAGVINALKEDGLIKDTQANILLDELRKLSTGTAEEHNNSRKRKTYPKTDQGYSR